MAAEAYLQENPGELLFTSRSSRIFQWKGSTLLKLFNSEVDPDLIRNEEINTNEAFSRGVSKVQCHGLVEVDGQLGLIMERVEGKTLISLAASKPGTALAVPALMASLQINMHRTETTSIRCYKEIVLKALESQPLSFLSSDERTLVRKKLDSLPDGNSILHLDYHPDNIMSDTREATIIDWMTAASGPPAADVAATLYLLNEGEMIPGLNRVVASVLESIRKLICRRYLKEYKKVTGIRDEDIAPWRLPFLIVRLGIWNIASEVDLLKTKIRQELGCTGV
ncbi:MAG: aminoglycoside phosphotransferase family protein [Spirochaetales bacterium]|nr:aminoglycoside phosphotransferase family protein [Spirochaetales bacterium]